MIRPDKFLVEFQDLIVLNRDFASDLSRSSFENLRLRNEGHLVCSKFEHLGQVRHDQVRPRTNKMLLPVIEVSGWIFTVRY